VKVTHGGTTEMIHPEKRFYPVADTSTTEVAIRKTLAVTSTWRSATQFATARRLAHRIAHHPLIDWVFGGAALDCVGGFMSLVARLRRRAPVAATESPAEEPAG
jgi:cytochrome c-type biogenesis protein CcmF